MNNYYIYIYFDPNRDNEPIYVGKGRGKRSNDHLTRTDKHPFVQRLQYMKKQNVKPIIRRVDFESEEIAFKAEAILIKEIGRKNLGTGPLLNLTDGGGGMNGWVCSDETRKKIGAIRKGKPLSEEHKAKMRAYYKNVGASDEHRANLSAAMTGLKKSPEHVQKMKERVFTAEHRAKLSAAQKNRKKKNDRTDKTET